MRRLWLVFALSIAVVSICVGQNISFPDPAFKQLLLSAPSDNIEVSSGPGGIYDIVDLNGDGEVSYSEAAQVGSIYIHNVPLESLDGIQYFGPLGVLGMENCGLLQLDVSGMLIGELIIKEPLVDLNLNNTNLWYISLENTALTTLDLSPANFDVLYLKNCLSLQTVFVKNGEDDSDKFASVDNCPALAYICEDEDFVDQTQLALINFGLSCEVNSYCDLLPGGVYYLISHSAHFDADNDGCDDADPFFSKVWVAITGAGNPTLDYGAQGGISHSIGVNAGSYSVVPILENPSYFNVNPSNVDVQFPVNSSPFEIDFCVTPNGVKHDVGVAILPVSVAIPGYAAQYRIVCRNQGNQPASGSLSFHYPEGLSLTNAGGGTVTMNGLEFEYTDQSVGATWVYDLTFIVNNGFGMPPVEEADVLDFSTIISCVGQDENPDDNTFTLQQTVVTSFDPNDKTCLEGNTLDPSMAGKYVHYLIRFENTGTANAQNIVVKDVIDTTKFDVSSLIPLDGSHPFQTRITSNNKVEFIFENIQLPFDDAHNDGFVAFKIKTKSTLIAGDTFSNAANIYFDYNAPIVTNTATTTLQALGASDFDFDRYLTIWPNPASDILHIEGASGVRSAQVYDLSGRLVTSFLHAKEMDLTQLEAGTYLLRVHTEKGVAATRFVKQ